MSTINQRAWQANIGWLVWRDDETEEEAREVYAFDAEEAAEDFAEVTDAEDSDYTIMNNGGGTVLCVRSALVTNAPVERFRVFGESVPQYNAMQLEARVGA